jgi:antitoxin component HigA of HigAB toxin-antitoxin module
LASRPGIRHHSVEFQAGVAVFVRLPGHEGNATVSTRCSNKLCVRHLNTRTRAEVMASVSHQWASGENSHLARITSKQVLLIRNLYAKGNVTQSGLAERFGMSTSNMKRILARRSWKHI